MGSSRYIPWQRIKSWVCLRCGQCCRQFKIIITPYEYAKLSHYSQILVQIDNSGDPVLRKVNGRCIAQDQYGSCLLQKVGMKPVACKIWPFTIFSNPKHREPEALFIHEGKEYFVYVDRAYSCPGINKGTPEMLPATIQETMEIYMGRKVNQLLSTSRLGHSWRIYGPVVRMPGEEVQLTAMQRIVQARSESPYRMTEDIHQAANMGLGLIGARSSVYRTPKFSRSGFIFGEV